MNGPWLPHTEANCAGMVAMMDVKISTDMPLPTPRSVMSSPNHMMTAVPAVMTMIMTRMTQTDVVGDQALVAAAEQGARGARQREDRRGLQDRQADRDVPRVLRDLRLAGLPVLLQRLQTRNHDGEQLQDDARGDVRHDAEREHRQLQQRTAAEEVDEGIDGVVLHHVDTPLDGGIVDTRGRHDRAEPVEGEQADREEDLLPKVRRTQGSPERTDVHLASCRTLTSGRVGRVLATGPLPTRPLRRSCHEPSRRTHPHSPRPRR